MKTKVPFRTAFLLGITTLSLQLPWIVAQSGKAASVPVTNTAIFETQTIAMQAGSAPLHANTLRVVTAAAPSPITTPKKTVAEADDPLKALVRPDIQPRHQALARKVLSLLPVDCQRKLKDFFVVYDDPGHRGLAGKGVIIMNGTLSDSEFTALLMHEGLGHFWDLTCTNGTKAAGESGFFDGDTPILADDPSASFYGISWTDVKTRKPKAQKTDFASGYAYSADPFEDLAESVVYYLLQQDAFRARAKTNAAMAKKLQWLDTYFPKHAPIAKGSAWDGTVAWNAVKIPYQLVAGSL